MVTTVSVMIITVLEGTTGLYAAVRTHSGAKPVHTIFISYSYCVSHIHTVHEPYTLQLLFNSKSK